MMGLSIRYALTTALSDMAGVRRLVEEIKRLALGLSFERVGPLIEVVRPLPLVCFPALPGKGCEPAAFGFCEVSSGGWQWSYSCCTQPASRPEHGGLDNFLRCHLAIISLLDAIMQSGLAQVKVKDDGGFWERREPEGLVERVRAWNDVDMIFTEGA